MKNLILLITFFLIATNVFGQWFYGSGKAVNLENDIGYNKNSQLIKSGVTVDPSSVATTGGAGSIILKTDGSAFIKKDAGLTTNWKKFLDESTNLLSYTPQATTATSGYLTSTDWNTFNGKENVLSFSSPLSRLVNTVSIPLATTGTSGYISSTDWNIFNNKADDISAITKDVTGFNDPSAVNVSYNTATDQVTITGDTSALWRGKAVTSLPSGWTSPPHPAGSGTWFLYYDGATATTTWSSTPWTFDKLMIALAYDQPYAHHGLREPHGQMPWLTHKELHETIGTYLSGGGDFSSYVLASTTAANRRPDISAATINDEDVPTVNAALTSKSYTLFKLTGAGATASITLNAADIVPLNGNVPYYNQFTGGAWTQTPMTNNTYQAIFVVAVPVSSDATSQQYRYQFIQGQTLSSSLATIQALTSSSVNLNGFVSSAPEFVYIGKIIIQYVGGGTANWNLVSVEKLTGNKITQGTSTGNWLSSVSTTTDFTGDGTALNPLALAASVTTPLNTLLGTANYIPKFTGTGLTSSVLYETSGKIGVGTATPTQLVSIYGSTPKYYMEDSVTGRNATLGFNDGYNLFLNSNAGATYIATNGSNVGFGTSSNLSQYVFNFSGGRFFTPSTTGAVFAVNHVTSATDSNTATSGTAAVASVHSFGAPTIAAFNPSVVTTKANNVYIASAVKAGVNETFTNTSGLYIDSLSVANGGVATNSYGLYANASTGATNNYAATFMGGNVGIGTTNPSRTLEINGTFRSYSADAGDMTISHAGLVTTIQSVPAVQLALGASGSEAIRINTLNNVGIGNTSPATKLHVTGDVTTTGYQYFGLPSVDGSFRMYVSGGALITEKRITGTWVELSRIDEL